MAGEREALREALVQAREELDVQDTDEIEHSNWLNSLSNLDEADKKVIKGSSRAPQSIEKYLDNKELQPLNIKQGCINIGCIFTVDLKNLRVPGMPISESLQPHQVTGIDMIREAYEDHLTRGLTVADSPGLGKTVTTSGFLQYVSILK